MSPRLALAAAACAVVALTAWPAPAQPSRAAELHAEGKALLEKGRVDEACGKMGESVVLTREVAALEDLARCHELQGRTATAWTEYVEVSVLAEKVGDAERAQRARESAGRLAPKVSRLRIDVAEVVPGLVVERDGRPLPAEDVGALVPVDPGPHVITAHAPGLEPFRAEVKVLPGGDARLVLIPKLGPKGSAPPAPKPPPEPTPPPDEDGRRGTSPMGIAGFVSSGAGVVGVIMGTIFGIQTLVEVSEAEDDERLCPKQRCTKLGRLAIDEAETKGIVSTVAFSIGGAALAAGIVLLVVDGLGEGEPEKARTVGVAPWVGPDGAGAALGLSF